MAWDTRVAVSNNGWTNIWPESVSSNQRGSLVYCIILPNGGDPKFSFTKVDHLHRDLHFNQTGISAGIYDGIMQVWAMYYPIGSFEAFTEVYAQINSGNFFSRFSVIHDQVIRIECDVLYFFFDT